MKESEEPVLLEEPAWDTVERAISYDEELFKLTTIAEKDNIFLFGVEQGGSFDLVNIYRYDLIDRIFYRVFSAKTKPGSFLDYRMDIKPKRYAYDGGIWFEIDPEPSSENGIVFDFKNRRAAHEDDHSIWSEGLIVSGRENKFESTTRNTKTLNRTVDPSTGQTVYETWMNENHPIYGAVRDYKLITDDLMVYCSYEAVFTYNYATRETVKLCDVNDCAEIIAANDESGYVVFEVNNKAFVVDYATKTVRSLVWNFIPNNKYCKNAQIVGDMLFFIDEKGEWRTEYFFSYNLKTLKRTDYNIQNLNDDPTFTFTNGMFFEANGNGIFFNPLPDEDKGFLYRFDSKGKKTVIAENVIFFHSYNGGKEIFYATENGASVENNGNGTVSSGKYEYVHYTVPEA